MGYFLFILMFFTTSLQETPTLWKGRPRPLEAAARDWMHEISPQGNALETLLNPKTHAPIKINNPELLTLLNVEQNASLSLLQQAMRRPDFVAKMAPLAFQETLGGARKQLASLEPDLIVEERGNRFIVISSKVLEKGVVFDPSTTLSKNVWGSFLELKEKMHLLEHPPLLIFSDGGWKELDDRPIDSTLYPEGTPYLEVAGKTLYYPSRIKLKAEVLLVILPWPLILALLYLISCRFHRLLILPFALHTFILGVRVWIMGRPPVANMEETLFWVPWVAGAIQLMFQMPLVRTAAGLTASTLLFISAYSWGTLSLEPVQAVLDSKFWLFIHVLMVVGSYAFFFVAGVLAHIQLVSTPPLSAPIRKTIQWGLCLLIPGTILGGVWAAESWGRFWDWDPKESWAFISAGVFLAVIHLDRYQKIGPFGLSVGAIIGFQAITFTWYGVNYILGTGLHSYGFSSGGELYYFIFVGLELMFLTACALKKRLTLKS